jgi:peptidoglycan/xylan/chitin deacetylase (PgdA/CDA1 family)
MRLRRVVRRAVAVGFAAAAACGAVANAATTSYDCAIHDGVVLHGARRSHHIALTFDACPTSHVPGFAPAIAEHLAREQVPATFFISGRWAEAHPRELAQLQAVPFFEIALHGYRHHKLLGKSQAAIVAEIQDGQKALARLGAQPRALFRPPFGDEPRILAAAARQAGVIPVLWDVAPGDPSPQETAADIERDVLRHVQGGSIIVLHVNGRGVGTADALPGLVRRLRERGFNFATVSELLNECRMATPQAGAAESTQP